MVKVADESDLYPRRPLWIQTGGHDENGLSSDGLSVLQPDEEGYDDAYKTAVIQAKYGIPMPYAVNTEDDSEDDD